jgi:LuxR family maltose regulon positive regulatory protein
VIQAAALRAGLHLSQGDLAAAQAWIANSGLSPDDSEASHPGQREVGYLSLARVLDAQGRQTEALSLLDRLMRSAQTEERYGSAIAILVLQSLVYRKWGGTAGALERLEHALALAEPEGYVRVFLDERHPMRALLADLQSMIKQRIGAAFDSRSLRLMAYADKLLAAFSPPTPFPTQASGTGIEPLSERELEILRLISKGLTNQEIAAMLVVAVSTVKSHINNLYGKLGTNRRTQAIAIARDLGLLSE